MTDLYTKLERILEIYGANVVGHPEDKRLNTCRLARIVNAGTEWEKYC